MKARARVRISAERHLYLLWFDREGNHKNMTELDIGFSVLRVGLFPSGTLLAFGYDENEQSLKLAMLKEDGMLLRFLQIRTSDAPESMFGTKHGSGKGPAVYIAPTELVPFGRSALLVQNNTDFPLFEVDEGGSTRTIHAQLPKGAKVEGLIFERPEPLPAF